MGKGLWYETVAAHRDSYRPTDVRDVPLKVQWLDVYKCRLCNEPFLFIPSGGEVRKAVLKNKKTIHFRGKPRSGVCAGLLRRQQRRRAA
eukprot:scaffold189976_cov24-Prasinocladus_malaysianus.AAC.1